MFYIVNTKMSFCYRLFTLHPKTTRLFSNTPNAFSLIEVIVALSILAFTLTTMMALLPMGLSASSDIRESNAISEIAQQVAGPLRQKRPSEIINSVTPSYYDRDGKAVDETDGTAFYSVTYEKKEDVKESNDANVSMGIDTTNFLTIVFTFKLPGGREKEYNITLSDMGGM